jgi:hypothetical protein
MGLAGWLCHPRRAWVHQDRSGPVTGRPDNRLMATGETAISVGDESARRVRRWRRARRQHQARRIRGRRGINRRRVRSPRASPIALRVLPLSERSAAIRRMAPPHAIFHKTLVLVSTEYLRGSGPIRRCRRYLRLIDPALVVWFHVSQRRPATSSSSRPAVTR